METVVELFNEDHLADPHIIHVFVVLRLMPQLWRKKMPKYAYAVLTMNVGSSFWYCPIHEPLVVLMVLPLIHVLKYRGKWNVLGSQEPSQLEDVL